VETEHLAPSADRERLRLGHLQYAPKGSAQACQQGWLLRGLGVRAEILPGICVLSLQLMSLKALSHLFLAANVPAKEMQSEVGARDREGT
jgi:hypothetical protein